MSSHVGARLALLVASPWFVLAACSSSGGTSSGGTSSGGTSSGASSGGGDAGGGGAGVTVGPALGAVNGTANTFGCAQGYPIQTNPTFPQPFTAQGASSCLVLTFVATGAPALRSGTAVSAAIRVGAVTGPMRFVRMRILFNRTQKQQCCSVEQYGDVFTPTANGDTTVALGFPMTLDPLPAETDLETIAANDLVALEVLAPDVPIPGTWTQNGGADTGTASYMWLPALSTQNIPAPSGQLLNYQGSYSGFVPSFNFTFVEGG
ncbi:MAG: hypothetical protein R3B36_01260 [Polyangiaceae bacterium]